MKVYTYNDKVLVNSANDKWLKKPDAPAGFVMDGSNATIANGKAFWEGPNYPSSYDGDGKTLQIIIKETGCTFASLTLYYCATEPSVSWTGGPYAIESWSNPSGNYQVEAPIGTYTTTLSRNIGTGDYGKYLVLQRNGPDSTIDSTWLSKIELRIID